MKNRRTLYKLATLVILLAVAGFIFFRPLPIMPSDWPNPCIVGTIIYRQDMLERVPMINDILKNHYARRTFNIPRGRLFNNAECEVLFINLMCRIAPIRISIGTNAVVFLSETDIIIRRIIDPTSLIDELLSVLSPYLLHE